MRRLPSAVCTLLALFACASSLRAQTITTGLLEGGVTDQVGAPLAEVLLVATPLGGGAARTTYTGPDGAFRFLLMAAGRYQVSAEKLGFRPLVLEGITVSANARVPLAVKLIEAPPPVEAAEHMRVASAATGSRAGASESLSVFDVGDLPLERRETSELARLASVASSNLEIEGLPSWMSTVYVDGVPYVAARHPRLSRAMQRELALPLNAISSADLVVGDADAEWGGFAGGALAATTRGGGNEFGAHAFGSWAGGLLQSPDLADATSTPNTSVWAGLQFGGPIIRDTAHYSIAIEARRLQMPTTSVWDLDNTAAQALIDAGTTRGVQLGSYTQPFSLGSTVVSGNGRFDWQLAGDHQLSVRGAFGSLSRESSDLDLASALRPESGLAGRDLLLSASFGSVLGRGWAHEIRVGVSNSTRDNADQTSLAASLPLTRLTNGVVFGSDNRLPGSFRRTEVRADQSLQIPFGQHQFKLGLDVALSSHRHDYDATGGAFTFGGTNEFAAGTGMFIRELNAAPKVSFSTLAAGAYVQDSWRAGPGLIVLGALRYDLESLPNKDVQPDSQWLRATALSNANLPRRVKAVSPRFAVTWDVGEQGRWIVRATAARYAQNVDPLLLSEALSEDGDVTVLQRFGNVNTWPTAPTIDTAAVRLTLISPDYRTPRSDRMSFSISTDVGGGTVLMAAGTYRATDFLPRRYDLNLVASAAMKDQYGRPVYGTLAQMGELLTAGVSNRRFAGYDVVSGIESDGSAEYRAVTIGLEHGMTGSVGLFARYTYSRTVDDWPIRSGDAQSQQSPLADQNGEDWRHGTSDFDLPHRVAAGVQLRPGIGLRPQLTLIYRYQSGYPFTPGFRSGVDANGDGVADNDPAFIDTSVGGVSDLTREWSCLSTQAGKFAERNSCREDSVHSLDVRLGLTLLKGKRTSGQLYVEALNALDNRIEDIDHAVFLVDPAGSLSIDTTNNVVNVPLIANPNFGKPLARFGTGRLLRIGFQVNH